MYIDATDTDAYHAEFPFHILDEDRPICHLEALNVVVALRLWAPQLAHQLITPVLRTCYRSVHFSGRQGS